MPGRNRGGQGRASSLDPRPQPRGSTARPPGTSSGGSGDCGEARCGLGGAASSQPRRTPTHIAPRPGRRRAPLPGPAAAAAARPELGPAEPGRGGTRARRSAVFARGVLRGAGQRPVRRPRRWRGGGEARGPQPPRALRPASPPPPLHCRLHSRPPPARPRPSRAGRWRSVMSPVGPCCSRKPGTSSLCFSIPASRGLDQAQASLCPLPVLGGPSPSSQPHCGRSGPSPPPGLPSQAPTSSPSGSLEAPVDPSGDLTCAQLHTLPRAPLTQGESCSPLSPRRARLPPAPTQTPASASSSLERPGPGAIAMPFALLESLHPIPVCLLVLFSLLGLLDTCQSCAVTTHSFPAPRGGAPGRTLSLPWAATPPDR